VIRDRAAVLLNPDCSFARSEYATQLGQKDGIFGPMPRWLLRGDLTEDSLGRPLEGPAHDQPVQLRRGKGALVCEALVRGRRRCRSMLAHWQ
jgi:hypothetical protein